VRQALDAEHEVVVLARTPSKIQIEDKRLTVIRGDVADAECVDMTIVGADAVLSMLAPTNNAPEQTMSRGMENILAAMKKHNVRRLVVSAGAGVGDTNDTPTLFNYAMDLLVRLAARNVHRDMRRVVELVRASDREWTIVRAPMLTNDPKTGNVHIGYMGKGMGARITRADLAEFMLKLVNDRRHFKKSPAVSN
jgi:putative NADH-flavin reductase